MPSYLTAKQFPRSIIEDHDIAKTSEADKKQPESYLLEADLTLFVCSDCNGKVSSSAMECVHCGNILQTNEPGIIGTLLRIFYAVFCVAIVVIGISAIGDASKSAKPSDAIMIPLIIFGVWFAGSVCLAMLFYVTRNGRLVRVSDAVLPTPEASLGITPKAAGWTRQVS